MAGGYFRQVGRAASRLLNALVGGDGASTFSAQSYDLALRGSAWGRWRVRFVDALPPNGAGHCAEAFAWHVEHGLLRDPRTPVPTTQVVVDPAVAPEPPKGA